LLGDLSDSKGVAIGMENFVIPGKAFFLQYLHLKWGEVRTREDPSDRETETFEISVQQTKVF
jgi:hypothetical protein